MAVTLEGTTPGDQGLFDRIGAIYSLLKELDTLRGETVPTKIEALQELFDGCTPDVRQSIETVFEAQATLQEIDPDELATMAAQIVIDMVHADNPLSELTLSAAVAELIRQMKASGDYVEANTVSATLSQSGLTGNGVIVTCCKNGQGYDLQNLLAEDLEVRVVSATRLRVQGEVEVGDKLSHDWPRGSGADLEYTPVIADSADSLLTNGTFDIFTANVPDGWDASGGTPGATVDDEGTIVHTAGGKALKITGNGSQNTTIYQDLSGLLEAQKNYAICLFCKNSSNPAAGEITIDLHDGSGVINDEKGTPNSLTYSLTALGTSWVAKYFDVRLPDPLPAVVRLRIRASTAITNTHVHYIDDLSLAAMQQPSGDDHTPYLQAFDGDTPFSIDDNAADGSGTFKVVTANNRVGVIQQALDRLLDMVGLELQLPHLAGSNEIDDSLFT